MVNFREITIVISFAAFVLSGELEDGDQQKRGVGKGPTINSIPLTQKPDSYNYYQPQSQNIGPIYSPPPPPPTSFYPNIQSPAQNTQVYQQNPHEQQQFYQGALQQQVIPLHYIPGSRIQVVQAKPGAGQVQLAVYPTQGIVGSTSYPINHGMFQHTLNHYPTLSPQNYNIPGGYFHQPLSFPQYLGQPSSMYIIAQPTHFANPYYSQNLLSYFQNVAPKQQLAYGSQASPSYQNVEYEKAPQQNPSKEDNEISVSANEYTASEYKTI